MGIFKLNKCDFYIGLYTLYMLQGVIYPQGIINQLLQLLMLLMGIVVAFPAIVPKTSHPRLLNAVFLLVALYAVYGLYIIITNKRYVFHDGVSSTPYTYLQASLNSLMPIFFFFICGKRGLLSEARLRAYFWIFLLLAVISYFKNYQAMLLEAALEGSERTEFTNNIGYSFVALMLFVPLFKKFLVRYGLLAFCFIFVMMGMKRGAIVIGAVNIAYFLYRDFVTTRQTRRRFIITLGIFAAIVAGTLYVQKLYDDSAYFRERVELTKHGYSSGRDRIYSKIWNHYWEDTSVVHLIVGNGAHSTISVAGNYAHQDWLETLYDTGIIGTCVLAYFFVVFFRTCRRSPHYLPPQQVTSFWMLLWVVFAQTLFSMSVQSLSITCTILLGYYISAMQSSVAAKHVFAPAAKV